MFIISLQHTAEYYHQVDRTVQVQVRTYCSIVDASESHREGFVLSSCTTMNLLLTSYTAVLIFILINPASSDIKKINPDYSPYFSKCQQLTAEKNN